MEIDLIWIGLGIAAAGYFIGEGLKNFKNPEAKSLISAVNEEENLNPGQELIPENHVHHLLGISEEDTKTLIQDHPDIPHIIINNKTYYPKTKLREWLVNIGN